MTAGRGCLMAIIYGEYSVRAPAILPGDRQSILFVQFKCYLLGEHCVFNGEVPGRDKAPASNHRTFFIELVDIDRGRTPNAVAFSGGASAHLEALIPGEPDTLGASKILHEQAPASRLRRGA